MEKTLPEFRKNLRLIDFGYKGSSYIYFVTLCTMDRQPLFSNTKIAKVIGDEMEYRRGNKEVKLYCYCIMPDHLHILLSPKLSDSFERNL
jgi:REP element-mobilizing transposase RayT